MGNTFGKLFTVTTFGESHGGGVGVVIDGCPPNLPLSAGDIQAELDRRRPGQSALSTPRNEADKVEILSGVYKGRTLGTPIALLVRNTDARPHAYDEIAKAYRPSHADFVYEAKYGLRNPEGGGRASARETIGRVAAGAIAQKILSLATPIKIASYVERVCDVALETPLRAFPTRRAIEASPVRCPDKKTAARMCARIEETRAKGDSVGGVIRVRIAGAPAGLGEPVFDRLHADLAKAIFSIPAVKGFEIGSGFGAAALTGSEHNDAFYMENGRVRTRTNRSGGVQGGISNGEEISLRVAFKPTATIFAQQETVSREGKPVRLRGKGRHDPCVLPRAVPIVDAMCALVLLDHMMRHFAQCRAFRFR